MTSVKSEAAVVASGLYVARPQLHLLLLELLLELRGYILCSAVA